MPSSALSMVEPVMTYLVTTRLRPGAWVLDVGPGNGKYGVLIREYLGHVVEQLDACEAEPRYLLQFPWLVGIYDDITVQDVIDLTVEDLGVYDVVLMADVLEHLDKGYATGLLQRIPGYVVINTPRDWFQNPEYREYPYEKHRSLWTLDELDAIRPLELRADSYVETHGAVLCRMAPL